MAKRFLGVWDAGPGRFGVAVSEQATELLDRPNARVSPLLPATPEGLPCRLEDAGALLMLVPRRATSLLATLMSDFPELKPDVFISHGHASLVLALESSKVAQELVNSVAGHITGHEIWPYQDGIIAVDDMTVLAPPEAAEWPAPGDVPFDNLGFEASAQVRQFNANLALFSRVAARYLPELAPLADWLHDSVTDIGARLETLNTFDATDVVSVRKALDLESLLVEVNAVLTLYISQVGSGQLPLTQSWFPVGEYSLLGIGGMCRSAWRLYSHLQEVFAKFDHVGRAQRRYALTGAFDALAPGDRIDYSAWSKVQAALPVLADGQQEDHRLHIPFFSSRWGFHESFHSISLSWQCLHASATKEWNLLTLTHEFLHAHVRDLLGKILSLDGDPEERDELVQRFRGGNSGTNALQSMQVAYIEALVGLAGCAKVMSEFRAGSRSINVRVISRKEMTVDVLTDLIRHYGGFLQEIVVHVLDYQYTYNGRDDLYVNSLWSSWSLVPSVNDRVPHYLLRTICALSATSGEIDNRSRFDDARARLSTHLSGISGRARSRPAIDEAIRALGDKDEVSALYIQFVHLRYIVELTQSLIYDDAVNAELVKDDLTTVQEEHRTYALDVGEYRGDFITSPVGFLLDRFESYSDQAGSPQAEFESLWQMLQLI